MCQARSQPELLHLPATVGDHKPRIRSGLCHKPLSRRKFDTGKPETSGTQGPVQESIQWYPENIPSRLESAHTDTTSPPPEPQKDRMKQATEHEPKGTEETECIPEMPGSTDNGRETERNAMNRPLKTTFLKKMTARSNDTRRRKPPSDRAAPKQSRLLKRQQRTGKPEGRRDQPATGTKRPEDRPVG